MYFKGTHQTSIGHVTPAQNMPIQICTKRHTYTYVRNKEGEMYKRTYIVDIYIYMYEINKIRGINVCV